MRTLSKKLDFLVLYVLVSLTAFGVMRKLLLQLADWMQQVPAAAGPPEHMH
jgi:hypothetical protein